jgi:peptide/nickel transport system substrate-binding protein
MSGRYLSDVDIANAVSGMLNDVGIKVSINVMEPGIFLKNLGSPARDLGPVYMIGWYSFGDADFAMTWYTATTGVRPGPTRSSTSFSGRALHQRYRGS